MQEIPCFPLIPLFLPCVYKCTVGTAHWHTSAAAATGETLDALSLSLSLTRPPARYPNAISLPVPMEAAICTLVAEFKSYAGKDGCAGTLSKQEFHKLVTSQLHNYVKVGLHIKRQLFFLTAKSRLPRPLVT